MTNAMSCADYLATLSIPQLCCWVRLNLSYNQVARVWLAINRSPMDKDMKDRHLGRCVICLCDYPSSNLHRELGKESRNKYQLLPNHFEIDQIVLGLINQAKEQHLGSLDLSCLSLNSLPEHLFELTDLENLYNSITTSSGLGNVIFDLITVANKEGWINQLISCAKEYNSGNEHLRVVADFLLNKR